MGQAGTDSLPQDSDSLLSKGPGNAQRFLLWLVWFPWQPLTRPSLLNGLGGMGVAAASQGITCPLLTLSHRERQEVSKVVVGKPSLPNLPHSRGGWSP